MKADHLNAAIYRVTVNGQPLVTGAFGSSMTGVPATTDMHFRNGSVAFSYLTTLLMEYVDQHKISLNDKISRWLPELPDAHQVTVKMLANMTSGYPDHVTDPKFIAGYYQNPFQHTPTLSSWPSRSPARCHSRPGKLGVRAHQHGDPGRDPPAGRRAPLADPAAAERPGPARPDQYHRVADRRRPRPGPACLQLRTPGRTGDPRGDPVLRRVHLLEPVLDHTRQARPRPPTSTTSPRRPRHRQRRPAVQVQLSGPDRAESARLRARAGRLCLRPADHQLQLRARHRADRLGWWRPRASAATRRRRPTFRRRRSPSPSRSTFAPQAFDSDGNWTNSGDPIFRPSVRTWPLMTRRPARLSVHAMALGRGPADCAVVGVDRGLQLL